MSTTPWSCSNIMYVRCNCVSGGTSSVGRAGSASAAATRRVARRLEQTVVERRGTRRQRLDVDRRWRRSLGRERRRKPRGPPERRARVERAERAPHRGFDDALDLPAIAKAHLGFRGMHVHVDHVRGDDDLEKQRRANAGRNRRAIRRLGRAHETRVAHGALIHRHEHAPSRGADVGRPLDETRDVRRAAHVVDVEQPAGERARRTPRRDGRAAAAPPAA